MSSTLSGSNASCGIKKGTAAITEVDELKLAGVDEL